MNCAYGVHKKYNKYDLTNLEYIIRLLYNYYSNANFTSESYQLPIYESNNDNDYLIYSTIYYESWSFYKGFLIQTKYFIYYIMYILCIIPQ